MVKKGKISEIAIYLDGKKIVESIVKNLGKPNQRLDR